MTNPWEGAPAAIQTGSVPIFAFLGLLLLISLVIALVSTITRRGESSSED